MHRIITKLVAVANRALPVFLLKIASFLQLLRLCFYTPIHWFTEALVTPLEPISWFNKLTRIPFQRS